MKILLINCNISLRLRTKFRIWGFPIGFATVIASLEEAGHDVTVLDLEGEKLVYSLYYKGLLLLYIAYFFSVVESATYHEIIHSAERTCYALAGILFLFETFKLSQVKGTPASSTVFYSRETVSYELFKE